MIEMSLFYMNGSILGVFMGDRIVDYIVFVNGVFSFFGGIFFILNGTFFYFLGGFSSFIH
jgi:hypothetical protein